MLPPLAPGDVDGNGISFLVGTGVLFFAGIGNFGRGTSLILSTTGVAVEATEVGVWPTDTLLFLSCSWLRLLISQIFLFERF